MRNRKFPCVSDGRRGWYILESTVALMGVAALVLAITDIARIFQARTAIRAGVTDGLRCLYPMAEECAAATSGGSSIEAPLFNASFQAPGGYELPRTSYTLSATWLNQPVLQVRKVKQTLSSVRVLYARDAYRDYNIKFPVDAHAAYLVQVRDLPWVELNQDSTLRPDAQVLRAAFRDRITGRSLPGDPPGNQVLELSQVKGITTRTTPQKIGEVSFSLHDAWLTSERDRAALTAFRRAYNYKGSIPCYHGVWSQVDGAPRITWPSERSPSTCHYQNETGDLFDGDDILVPIMLRVRGDRYATSKTAKGIVSAVLEYQSGDQIVTFPLGGRRFEATTDDSNFIIRGAGRGFDAAPAYFEQCLKAGYTECDKYSALPLIPRRSVVKISFYLERAQGTGTVGWAGDRIQLFYPQFALGQESVSCGTSLVPHKCDVSVAPMRPLLSYTDLSTGLRSEVVVGSETKCLRDPPAGSFDSEQTALASLQSGMLSDTGALVSTSFTARESSQGAACDPDATLYSCADAGVTGLKGCVGPRAYSDDFVLSACSVADFAKGRDRIEDVVTKETELSSVDERLGCSEESYPVCAEPYITQVGERFLGQDDSGACARAIPRSCASWNVPAYFDVESRSECPDIAQDLEREYRQTCESIPVEANVSVISKVEEPLSSITPPSTRCQKFTQRASVEVQCASGAPYAVAQACCQNNPSGCIIRQVTAGGLWGGGDVWLQRGARAVARAQETIVTAYPRASFSPATSCPATAKHCVQIPAPGPPDANSRVRMQATMQVPLILLGWFGLDTLSSVTYSEERVLEASLFR